MKITHLFALYVSSEILPVASHGSRRTQHHESSPLGQSYLGDGDFIDVVTDSQFFGLGTFANLPYMNCLSSTEDDEGRYDIAILGAPFDTVGNVNCNTNLVIY